VALLLLKRLVALLCVASLVAGARPAFAQAGTATGAWHRLPPPNFPWQEAVGIESGTGRLVFLTRENDVFGLWTFDHLGTGTWESKPLSGTVPRLGSERYFFDDSADRFLVLGVYWTASDTWPPIYDMRLYELALGPDPQWVQIPIAGESPEARRDAALAFDAPTHRIFLVGGRRLNSEFSLGETWELSLEPTPAWRRIVPDGGDLPPRGGGMGTYDRERDRLFVLGGSDSLAVYDEGLRAWELDLGAGGPWTELAPAESVRVPYVGPVVLTPGDERLRLLRPGESYQPVDSTYLLVLDPRDGGSWSREPVSGALLPNWSGEAVGVFDAARQTIVYVGTAGARGDTPYGPSAQHVDVWSLAMGGASATWTRQYESLPADYYDLRAPMAYDPVRGQVHGWSRYPGGLLSFRLGDQTGWIARLGGYPAAPTRTGAVSAFDPISDVLSIFGGGDRDVEYGDLWQASPAEPFAHWVRRIPDGESPSPRTYATAVYDPGRRRMVMFGGFAGRAMNDLWQLDLAAHTPRWTPIAARGTPPSARWGHTAVYDSRRDAMIVFGGAAGEAMDEPQPMHDLWSLSFADGDAWVPLAAEGSAPPSRYRHAAVYDPVGDRMMVLWGLDATGTRFDTAMLDFGVTPRWQASVPGGFAPADRADASVFYDSVRDRAIVLGGIAAAGNYSGMRYGDAWAIEWNRADREPPPLPVNTSTITLLGLGPNPSPGDVDIAFEVPGTTIVTARMYDVRGRIVRDFGERSFTPGRHLLHWDGRDDAGGRLPDGVYFARVEAGSARLMGKLVLVD
jgi:hypothetical protein